jgi:CubicO group peptidase (beta-lactamase class C family)
LWIGAPDDVIERAAKLRASRPRKAGETPDAPKRGATSPARGGTLLGRMASAYGDPGSRLNRALNNPSPGKGGYNNPVVLRAGWPAAGMLTTAPGLAGFYRDLVAGRIVKPETLQDALKPRVSGPDLTLLMDTSFGLGYMRPSNTFFTPAAGRESAFGHTGAGGSIGLGDSEADLAVAYLPNLMGDQLSGDVRAYGLVEAVYAALAG